MRGYVGSIENGRPALLVASTNVDVDDFNLRVHGAIGEERTYRTAFAIGEIGRRATAEPRCGEDREPRCGEDREPGRAHYAKHGIRGSG